MSKSEELGKFHACSTRFTHKVDRVFYITPYGNWHSVPDVETMEKAAGQGSWQEIVTAIRKGTDVQGSIATQEG